MRTWLRCPQLCPCSQLIIKLLAIGVELQVLETSAE